MPDILLSTLNAKYAHSSLALRYLHANLGELAARSAIREFTIHDRPVDVAEEILAQAPRIVGLGIYIWNASHSAELVRILKALQPELVVVLGGPEVSHECELQEIVRLADYTICGEGDVAFAELCHSILIEEQRPRAPIVRATLPDLATLESPYGLYTDHDIESRSVYVEASRGCPFACEFCLSSLDKKVRPFPLDIFLGDMETLIERGVRHFKFIDRTFNLKASTSVEILEFFLERIDRGLFVHFEMVPDRLPPELRELIVRFPAGSLQFEIGVQTFDEATGARISRRQDLDKLTDNFQFLTAETGVHVHADLIVGLPGEDIESFGRGFDRLVALEPQEIQVGILKRLRGTPIARHTDEHNMVYSTSPPYEILETGVLSFGDLQRLKRFARAWDLVANSGNFRESKALLWGDGSPFAGFLAFSDWLFGRAGHFKGVALTRLCELVVEYLIDHRHVDSDVAKTVVARDFTRSGRRAPAFLADYAVAPAKVAVPRSGTPKRQARHLP